MDDSSGVLGQKRAYDTASVLRIEREQVLLSVMARRDGEAAPLGPEEVDVHLAACPACREEATADAALHARLEGVDQTRPSLWGSPRPRLGNSSRRWTLIAAAVLVCAPRGGVLVQLPSGMWLGSLVPSE